MISISYLTFYFQYQDLLEDLAENGLPEIVDGNNSPLHGAEKPPMLGKRRDTEQIRSISLDTSNSGSDEDEPLFMV